MSKAFDSVSNPILLHKLKCIGASTQAVEWFKRYLSCRRQYVRIGSTVSFVLPLSVIACYKALSYHHYCFVLIQMTCQRSHYQVISTLTQRPRNAPPPQCPPPPPTHTLFVPREKVPFSEMEVPYFHGIEVPFLQNLSALFNQCPLTFEVVPRPLLLRRRLKAFY